MRMVQNLGYIADALIIPIQILSILAEELTMYIIWHRDDVKVRPVYSLVPLDLLTAYRNLVSC